jgi:hypothetical protein
MDSQAVTKVLEKYTASIFKVEDTVCFSIILASTYKSPWNHNCQNAHNSAAGHFHHFMCSVYAIWKHHPKNQPIKVKSMITMIQNVGICVIQKGS